MYILKVYSQPLRGSHPPAPNPSWKGRVARALGAKILNVGPMFSRFWLPITNSFLLIGNLYTLVGPMLPPIWPMLCSGWAIFPVFTYVGLMFDPSWARFRPWIDQCSPLWPKPPQNPTPRFPAFFQPKPARRTPNLAHRSIQFPQARLQDRLNWPTEPRWARHTVDLAPRLSKKRWKHINPYLQDWNSKPEQQFQRR